VKSNNKVTGNRGEEIAGKYLENKGYKIIERNFRTRFGEIDIICSYGQMLVFVEVKTKIGHDFGEPEEMVNKSKISKVKRMGEVYLQDKGISAPCRVDVVAIVLENNGSVEKLEHYQAVY
jgi:putative endonuclease